MIIFDLDGTLACCEHRRHFVDPSKNEKFSPVYRLNQDLTTYQDGYENPFTGKKFKPDWDAFHEACDKDEPIMAVCEVFKKLWNTYEKPIQIWSGRSESTRRQTDEWLSSIGLPCGSLLKMRPIGDYTPDDQLKERWLDEAISEGKSIDFVIDDRPKVVQMWRRRGIFVFDVNQSGKEF